MVPQSLTALRFEIAEVAQKSSFGVLQLGVDQQVEPVLELQSTLRAIGLARLVSLVLVSVQLVQA